MEMVCVNIKKINIKNLITLSLLLLVSFFAKAQRQTEYNRRGDEALERKDYQTALYWYEQGVANCDRYSIDRLTAIWNVDSTMHVSMRVAMGRCLNCLNDLVINNKDTLAIKKIIEYHSEGIGTPINEVSANYWKEQLEQIRNPVFIIPAQNIPKEKMKFFAGYHASAVAPFGIQVGGMGKTVGWYVRFGSNLSFQNAKYDCEVKNNHIIIEELEKEEEGVMYRDMGNTKETWLKGSAGLMIKVVDNTFVSVGVGYWDRKYNREYIKVDDRGFDKSGSTGWAKDTNSSMSGFSVDLDGTYAINGKFYVTLGASVMSFKFVYPHLGVGVYF